MLYSKIKGDKKHPRSKRYWPFSYKKEARRIGENPGNKGGYKEQTVQCQDDSLHPDFSEHFVICYVVSSGLLCGADFTYRSYYDLNEKNFSAKEDRFKCLSNLCLILSTVLCTKQLQNCTVWLNGSTHFWGLQQDQPHSQGYHLWQVCSALQNIAIYIRVLRLFFFVSIKAHVLKDHPRSFL